MEERVIEIKRVSESKRKVGGITYIEYADVRCLMELKECPFCGAKPHINVANFVWCSNYKCSLRGPVMFHINEWNKRHLTSRRSRAADDCASCGNTIETGICPQCDLNMDDPPPA